MQSIRNLRRRGLSYSAIAIVHGLSANTVKSFCRRENIDIKDDLYDEDLDLCKNCGEPLKHLSGSKKKIFCSDKCRYGWWNKNRVYLKGEGAYTLTCFHCGNEFHSNNKKRKFCSRDCYIRGRYGEGMP